MAVGIVLLIAVAAAGWREWPHWRVGGAQPVSAGPVSRNKGQLACPQSGSRIVIVGDSHVAGAGGVSAVVPFGRVMESALPGGPVVELRGAGGDTAEMGAMRWLDAPRAPGDRVIIAYGSNDAAPRGWLRAKRPVPQGRFEAALTRHIVDWQQSGAQVMLLAPPPGGSAAMAERLSPYREATAQVGEAAGLAVLDPAEAFAQCSGSAALLDYDGLHMSAAGHRCLGTWLAQQLCPGGD